jgi:hypothetical protein
MRKISIYVFEWTAVLTWSLIIGMACLYGLLYSLNVIYSPRKSLERLPDHPHLASASLRGDY